MENRKRQNMGAEPTASSSIQNSNPEPRTLNPGFYPLNLDISNRARVDDVQQSPLQTDLQTLPMIDQTFGFGEGHA
ncbi:MAG TPA: hypothetical protein PL045_07355, partial [Chitinophagaceae bacterium]|nr:hypothetical protein [Chitinophagaceae bacterium]